MSKRAALVPVMLLVGVVAAVVGATAALRFIGGGAFGPGGQPLTPADVQRSLAQAAAAQSSPAPGGQNPTPSPARGSAPARTNPALGSLAASGGTVYATCLSGQVRLTSWSPAQNYQTDGYSRGPAATAWVKFKSGTAELTISVACMGGQPRFTTSVDDAGAATAGGGGAGTGGGGGEVGDDHGGGGGSGRGGGGSGSGRGGG